MGAGYIIWVGVSSPPGDTLTLRPLLEEMEKHLRFKYRDIVVNAGYESEENYVFLKKNRQIFYIKPTNYEISRTRIYKTYINFQKNIEYDKETATYTCKNNRQLTASVTKTSNTASGYKNVSAVYTCRYYSGCSSKENVSKGTTIRPRWKSVIKSFMFPGIKRRNAPKTSNASSVITERNSG